MKDERTPLERYLQVLKDAIYLAPYNWRLVDSIGYFEREGRLFDLTSADVTKHEEIFEKGIFEIV